jgi:hypothetical protein
VQSIQDQVHIIAFSVALHNAASDALKREQKGKMSFASGLGRFAGHRYYTQQQFETTETVMAVSSAASGVNHSQASLKSLMQPRQKGAEARRPSVQSDNASRMPQEAAAVQRDIKEPSVGAQPQQEQGNPALMPVANLPVPTGPNAYAVSAYSSMMAGFQPKTSLSALA